MHIMYVYVYIYIYIYMYVYVYICIYIHTGTWPAFVSNNPRSFRSGNMML